MLARQEHPAAPDQCCGERDRALPALLAVLNVPLGHKCRIVALQHQAVQAFRLGVQQGNQTLVIRVVGAVEQGRFRRVWLDDPEQVQQRLVGVVEHGCHLGEQRRAAVQGQDQEQGENLSLVQPRCRPGAFVATILGSPAGEKVSDARLLHDVDGGSPAVGIRGHESALGGEEVQVVEEGPQGSVVPGSPATPRRFLALLRS